MKESALRRNAQVIDELDVTLGFANLAAEMDFVRPTLTEEYAEFVPIRRLILT